MLVNGTEGSNPSLSAIFTFHVPGSTFQGRMACEGASGPLRSRWNVERETWNVALSGPSRLGHLIPLDFTVHQLNGPVGVPSDGGFVSYQQNGVTILMQLIEQ